MSGRKALETHAKVVLLLSQELPQCPFKPMAWLTPKPIHKRVRLETADGVVVGDLFRPARRSELPEDRTLPAVVLAFGMTLHERDRPILLGLARTLARLGFVVLWPRLESVDAGSPLPEEPGTFGAGVGYLAALDGVDQRRVSLFGFSGGASTALVAASTPHVADGVHAVLFFGGFYDLLEYVVTAATETMIMEERVVAWKPSDEVIRRLEPMLEVRAPHVGRALFGGGAKADRMEAETRLRRASTADLNELRRLSPAEHIGALRARVFILHDRGDTFVPWVESAKLRAALPQERVGGYLLTDLFAHAQPKAVFSWGVVGDIVRLYRFLYAVLAYF